MNRPAVDRTVISSGLRILLVEDDMLIAMMVEDALRVLGCHIIGPASRVSKAVRLAATEAIDGAILDINLAGERVDPVAAELCRRRIPFVFVTGYDATAAPDHYGDRPILQKPFRLQDLERIVTKAFVTSATR